MHSNRMISLLSLFKVAGASASGANAYHKTCIAFSNLLPTILEMKAICK